MIAVGDCTVLGYKISHILSTMMYTQNVHQQKSHATCLLSRGKLVIVMTKSSRGLFVEEKVQVSMLLWYKT